ncbi:MAG: thermonuclease family protein [Candidatus Omnitrophica bacterium]|nr:thermonuclease family protein [Candidatus Omnitrophota bacterium]
MGTHKFACRIALIIVIILFSAHSFCDAADFASFFSKKYPLEDSPDLYYVKKVLDGHTLELSNGRVVRLLGVETPPREDRLKQEGYSARYNLPIEIVEEYSELAYAFTEFNIEEEEVLLVFQEGIPTSKQEDGEGHFLAFVYRASDYFFLNGELIRNGYGVLPSDNVGLLKELDDSAKEAQGFRMGIWKGLKK